MIRLTNVAKDYPSNYGMRRILHDINLTINPGERIGILGRNGAGKSTLIRLISGAEPPTSGSIERHMSVSWPLAFSGGFQGGLTGADNVRFICRIYGVDYHPRFKFVEEFSELGTYIHEPVSTYSSGMRARLAFAISMTVDFDCYLIDEVMAVGDQRFRDRCQVELFEKRLVLEIDFLKVVMFLDCAFAEKQESIAGAFQIAVAVRNDQHALVSALLEEFDLTPVAESLVANRHYLVDQVTIEVHRHRNGKCKSGPHARRIG